MSGCQAKFILLRKEYNKRWLTINQNGSEKKRDH